MVIGLEFWLGFGELRISVDELGLKLGFGRLGASKRVWAPNVLARDSSEVGFWIQGSDQGFVCDLVPVFQDWVQVQNQIRGLVLDYHQN